MTLETLTAALAGALRAGGVGRGDVVSWQLANCDEAAALYRACWRLGAIAAPVHHLAGDADRDRMLAQVDPALVIDGERLSSLLSSAAPAVPAGDDAGQPFDDAAVLFTSGSSGEPKAVIHTRGALEYKGRLMVDVHGLGPDDAVLMPAPLAHISGLLNGVLVPGAAGMRTVYMAKWDPDEALRIIERAGITFMVGPPTFFLGLLSAMEQGGPAPASLRLVSTGGAGVTPAFVDEASAGLDCQVKRTYGSTEAPTVTTTHLGDDPRFGRDTDGRATGSVELRVDTNGELLVKGPELFRGYARATDNDGAFTGDGFFRTGDLGVLDDGWLTITGRLKDMIIRGGENIATAEVEAVLESHPAVRAAVAVGYPDPRLGERVAAFVVLAAGASFDLDACRSWFTERGVARFKTPERFVVVDELPVLAAGKPDRAALRARLGRNDQIGD